MVALQRKHALALLAVAILAVPAGFAAVSVGDHLLAKSSPPVASTASGNVAQRWEGTIGADVMQGTLDLRTFRGPVHVVGVEGDAWSVQVLLPAGNPGAVAVPQKDTLAYDFHGDVDQDGALALALQVTRDGSALVALNSEQVPTIEAQVPARLLWQTVFLCSATNSQFSLLNDLFPSNDTPDARSCVRDDSPTGLGLDLQTDPTTQSKVVPFLVEGIHGEQLHMLANDEAMATKDVGFAQAQLVTNNGDLQAAGAFEAVQGVTNNGEIHAVLTNPANAKAQFVTNNGEVRVMVPVAENRAYAVHAVTNNGEITIDLPDMEGKDSDQGQAGTGVGLLQLGAAKSPRQPHGSSDHQVSAQSKSFEDAAVQTMLDVTTNNGDVYVGPLKAGSA